MHLVAMENEFQVIHQCSWIHVMEELLDNDLLLRMLVLQREAIHYIMLQHEQKKQLGKDILSLSASQRKSKRSTQTNVCESIPENYISTTHATKSSKRFVPKLRTNSASIMTFFRKPYQKQVVLPKANQDISGRKSISADTGSTLFSKAFQNLSKFSTSELSLESKSKPNTFLPNKVDSKESFGLKTNSTHFNGDAVTQTRQLPPLKVPKIQAPHLQTNLANAHVPYYYDRQGLLVQKESQNATQLSQESQKKESNHGCSENKPNVAGKAEEPAAQATLAPQEEIQKMYTHPESPNSTPQIRSALQRDWKYVSLTDALLRLRVFRAQRKIYVMDARNTLLSIILPQRCHSYYFYFMRSPIGTLLLRAFWVFSLVLSALVLLGILDPFWMWPSLLGALSPALTILSMNFEIMWKSLKSFDTLFIFYHSIVASISCLQVFNYDERGIFLIIGLCSNVFLLCSDALPARGRRMILPITAIGVIFYTFLSIGILFEWFPNIDQTVYNILGVIWSPLHMIVSHTATICIFYCRFMYTHTKSWYSCFILRARIEQHKLINRDTTALKFNSGYSKRTTNSSSLYSSSFKSVKSTASNNGPNIYNENHYSSEKSQMYRSALTTGAAENGRSVLDSTAITPSSPQRSVPIISDTRLERAAKLQFREAVLDLEQEIDAIMLQQRTLISILNGRRASVMSGYNPSFTPKVFNSTQRAIEPMQQAPSSKQAEQGEPQEIVDDFTPVVPFVSHRASSSSSCDTRECSQIKKPDDLTSEDIQTTHVHDLAHMSTKPFSLSHINGTQNNCTHQLSTLSESQTNKDLQNHKHSIDAFTTQSGVHSGAQKTPHTKAFLENKECNEQAENSIQVREDVSQSNNKSEDIFYVRALIPQHTPLLMDRLDTVGSKLFGEKFARYYFHALRKWHSCMILAWLLAQIISMLVIVHVIPATMAWLSLIGIATPISMILMMNWPTIRWLVQSFETIFLLSNLVVVFFLLWLQLDSPVTIIYGLFSYLLAIFIDALPHSAKKNAGRGLVIGMLWMVALLFALYMGWIQEFRDLPKAYNQHPVVSINRFLSFHNFTDSSNSNLSGNFSSLQASNTTSTHLSVIQGHALWRISKESMNDPRGIFYIGKLKWNSAYVLTSRMGTLLMFFMRHFYFFIRHPDSCILLKSRLRHVRLQINVVTSEVMWK